MWFRRRLTQMNAYFYLEWNTGPIKTPDDSVLLTDSIAMQYFCECRLIFFRQWHFLKPAVYGYVRGLALRQPRVVARPCGLVAETGQWPPPVRPGGADD